MKILHAGVALLCILFLSFRCHAIDEVRFEQGQSANDVRMAFKLAILQAALEKTRESYGAYRISTNAPQMNTLRAQAALKEGEIINVYIALTDRDWEKIAIPIKIPVRRGILNYRLLLVHKDDLPRYKDVYTLDDLKKFSGGSLHSWTTTRILDLAGFDVIEATSYDGLFTMLNAHRYHFLPRGIHEIYGEFEQLHGSLANIAIEPNLLLVIPAPSYVFVSPKFPRLATRLKEGLETMVRDGTLKAIVDDYFAADIEKAALTQRRIIRITNPLLPEGTPLDRKELWFDPFKNK